MKCPFCGTEIRKILKPPLLEKSYGQAWERCPLEYECEGCIHVWLTKECAEDFRTDNFIADRLKDVSKAIKTKCDTSKEGRLDEALSLPDVHEILEDYYRKAKI